MSKPPSAEQKSLVGYTIGRCKLLRICGRGAMGTVYKGMHGGLDIEVAVKILPPHLANNRNLVERFIREAKLAARLNHINTVRVYDVGDESGYYYLVMEFIDGSDALELVKRYGPQTAAIVADIGAGAARALDHAHHNDVIHRDIKPANLMLPNDGGVKVADFGLARALASESGLTMTGAIMGTPDYMAPEQAQGESVGPGADVYSLGATLYHLFVGRPAFVGASPMAVAIQHVTSRIVVSEEKVVDDTSQALTRVIHQLTDKDPFKRSGDLSVIARQLQEIARMKRGTEKLLSDGATLYSAAGFKMNTSSINKAKAQEAHAKLNGRGELQSPHLDKLRQAAEKARSGLHGGTTMNQARPGTGRRDKSTVTGETQPNTRRSSGGIKPVGADTRGGTTQKGSNPGVAPHRDKPSSASTSSQKKRIVQNPELEDDAWESYAAKAFPTFEKSSIMDGSARQVATQDQDHTSSIRSSSDISSGSSPGMHSDYSTPSTYDARPRRQGSSAGFNVLVAVLVICGFAALVWNFVLRDDTSHRTGPGQTQHIGMLTASTFRAFGSGEDVTSIAPDVDSGTYFSGSEDGRIIRWDLGGQKPESSKQLSIGSINAMQMRSDGDRLAVGGADGTVSMLDPKTLEVVRTGEMRVDGAVTALQMIGVVGIVVGDNKGRLTLSSATRRMQVDADGAPVTGIVFKNNFIWAAAGETVARYKIKDGELEEVSSANNYGGRVGTIVSAGTGIFAIVENTIVEVTATGPGRRTYQGAMPVLGVTVDGLHLFTVGQRGIEVLTPGTLELVKSAPLELKSITTAGGSGNAGQFYLGSASGEMIACTLN